MSPRRLTPVYADAPAPPAPRRALPRLRVAKMDLPVLILLYGVLCGWRLLGDNLLHAGLDLEAWTRARLHFRDALAQAIELTIVLVAFDLTLRLGAGRERAAK